MGFSCFSIFMNDLVVVDVSVALNISLMDHGGVFGGPVRGCHYFPPTGTGHFPFLQPCQKRASWSAVAPLQHAPTMRNTPSLSPGIPLAPPRGWLGRRSPLLGHKPAVFLVSVELSCLFGSLCGINWYGVPAHRDFARFPC